MRYTKIIGLVFFVLSFVLTPLKAEKKLPEMVSRIIKEQKTSEKYKAKIAVAKNIAIHMKTVEQISLRIDGGGAKKKSILVIAEYLCPHCQNFLSEINKIDLKKEKINFSILSLPIFDGDLSRQYGLILEHAYKETINESPKKFLEILAQYRRGDKAGLIKLVREGYNVEMADDVFQNTQEYEDNAKLAEELGVPSVPMLFYILDDKAGSVVVPLLTVEMKSIIAAVKKLEKLSAQDIKHLKKDLGQE